MTRHLFPAILIGTLAAPAVALAQHQAGSSPSSGTATSSAPAPSSGGSTSSSSSGGGSTGGSTFSAGSTSGDSGSGGRRRGNSPASGTAVRRGGSSGGSGGGVIIGGSGFYPWGYAYGGAIADAGYFGGYYGAYDPWYGWFPTYAPSASGGDNSGSVRLKVKPAEASVYVDGFYVGIVDDFDGAFQRLHLDPGPHRLEMREQSYQPLSVDVMIQEDFTITYRGELAKQ